ncbi:MAG: response regulator [Ignavibacteriaceae bacterium]
MNTKLKILVLDDEEIVVTRLKAALEKDGYIVETFIDSRLAKERIEQNKFDIVVTDLKMANIDGMQLFQFIKQKYPDTEVILISGFATLDVVKNGLQAGVRDVIAKPFKISQIKELINKIAADMRN